MLSDWTLLNNKASSIRTDILCEWHNLINEKHKEEVYQNYLAENAGMFFLDSASHFICIEKLRLGSDYIIDFAIAEEGYSNGLSWHLFELELPSTPPFTKDGIPSARLSRAIQQIHDWKRWLIDNRREAEKIFPAYGIRTSRHANFKFSIVIGTRENTNLWIAQREQLSKSLEINIISYDRVGEWLSRRYFSDTTHIGSSEAKYINFDERRSLANPFVQAFTDKGWRQFLNQKRAKAHFVPSVADVLVRHRPINNSRLAEFQTIAKHIIKANQMLTISSTTDAETARDS